ncbi:unnamed protein product [Meloidogyne enterolobii]|uniref:Uncharacterized protein n=1 Tax=Meloidogyne enterolobii TaxID=390850 RepID=A0ACB0Y693_MELEN
MLPYSFSEGTAQLPRFGYEPSTQQCHQFIYRGLKGNQNNFLTLEECQLACLPNPCPSGKNILVGVRTQGIFSSIGIFISGILPTQKQNSRFREIGIPTQKSVSTSRFSGIFGNRGGRTPGIHMSVNSSGNTLQNTVR